MLSAYEGPMFALLSHHQPFLRRLAALALLASGTGLSGCASVGDAVSPAFADPAKYDLYECKQLEPERKGLATKVAELQGLMAKAETGVAGTVVAEMAYRNELIAIRGQQKLAEEAWRHNKCQESKPESKPVAGAAAPSPGVRGAGSSKAGSAVY
jgi:hypothetical protein